MGRAPGQLGQAASLTTPVPLDAPSAEPAMDPASPPRGSIGESFRVGRLEVALGLATLGQAICVLATEHRWAGVACLALGGFVFSRVSDDASVGGRPAAVAWRPTTLLASILMTTGVLATVGAAVPSDDYTTPTALWIGAMGANVLAFARWHHPGIAWTPWWRAHGRAALLVGAIFLVALGLRLWQLASVPITVSGDEGEFGLEAARVLKGQIRSPFTTGWLGNPTMGFFFTAPSIAWLGQTSLGLRLPWALLGALTVPLVFWLVSRLQGWAVGLAAAGLLATYHYHIHFSRLGINNIADPFFATLTLLLLYRGYDRRSLASWALAGLAMGIAQYFYFGARAIPLIAMVVGLALLVRCPSAHRADVVRGLLTMTGAGLTAAAPMIQYALRYPAEYMAPLSRVGLLQGGRLDALMAVRNVSAPEVLLDQIQRSVLAFNVYPDPTFWYQPGQPLFDAPSGVLFILGLGYATVRGLDPRLFPLAAWWWLGTLLGGAMTENPPSSQRLIGLSVPAVAFVALALIRVGVAARSWLDPRWRAVALSIAVAVISALSVKFYFVEYTPRRVYGGPNAVVANTLASYASQQLGREWRMYFFGPPRMYIDYGTIAFLAPEVEGVDVREVMATAPPPGLIQFDKRPALVFLPERRGELEMVRRTYPEGRVEEIPSPLGGEPLFVVYRIEPPPRS